MDFFSKLAEARIREWQQRPEKERADVASTPLSIAPLEVQLFDEAMGLYARARSTVDPAEREAALAAAARIETRVMVLLEESGRPLAAQQFAKMFAAERETR
jgi:hypothetical protein